MFPLNNRLRLWATIFGKGYQLNKLPQTMNVYSNVNLRNWKNLYVTCMSWLFKCKRCSLLLNFNSFIHFHKHEKADDELKHHNFDLPILSLYEAVIIWVFIMSAARRKVLQKRSLEKSLSRNGFRLAHQWRNTNSSTLLHSSIQHQLMILIKSEVLLGVN